MTLSDDELISLFESAGDYALLGDAQKMRLIALARIGASVMPRPIMPNDKWILVELKAFGKWDKEPIVLHKTPNGNWHSSGGEHYCIGEDFENLVWPLPLSALPKPSEVTT